MGKLILLFYFERKTWEHVVKTDRNNFAHFELVVNQGDLPPWSISPLLTTIVPVFTILPELGFISRKKVI